MAGLAGAASVSGPVSRLNPANAAPLSAATADASAAVLLWAATAAAESALSAVAVCRMLAAVADTTLLLRLLSCSPV
jgi:hypothetical protein